MQHIIQFAIFLVLATAQLTSAAVRGSVLCKVNRFLCFKYSVYMLCTSVMTYFLFLQPILAMQSHQTSLYTQAMFTTLQTSFIPVPPLTLDPFTLVVEQIVRSYSKFPLLLQGSLMHMPPIRVTVRFQPVSGDSDPVIGIVMELMQTFGIATTILHVVYLMAHMRTNVSAYHLSLLFNLKSQH